MLGCDCAVYPGRRRLGLFLVVCVRRLELRGSWAFLVEDGLGSGFFAVFGGFRRGSRSRRKM